MEEDLRSSGAGLRGFKSHPRHHLRLFIFSIVVVAEPLYTKTTNWRNCKLCSMGCAAFGLQAGCASHNKQINQGLKPCQPLPQQSYKSPLCLIDVGLILASVGTENWFFECTMCTLFGFERGKPNKREGQLNSGKKSAGGNQNKKQNKKQTEKRNKRTNKKQRKKGVEATVKSTR